jgi:hypothetical protein
VAHVQQHELDGPGSPCATHIAVLTHSHSRPNIKNAVPKINAVARVFIDKLAECTAGGKGICVYRLTLHTNLLLCIDRNVAAATVELVAVATALCCC